MADEAAADSVTPYKEILAMADKSGVGGLLGSIYAVNTAPERRSVTKISGGPGNYKTELVTDYNGITKMVDEIRQYSARQVGVKTEGSPEEFADLDDDGWLQQLLITAWTQVAQYYSNCEEDDRSAARGVMNSLSAMIAGNDDDTAAGNTFTCEYCQRNFASEGAAIKHLSTVHSAREKETKMKTERD